MSIRDTISAALKSDPEELAAAAHATLQSLRDKLTTAQANEAEITGALAIVDGEIDDAAKSGDRKQWQAARDKRAQLENELEFKRAEQRGHAADLREAELALHKARLADQLKVARRHANVRAKAAQKMRDGIAILFEGWQDMHADAAKVAVWGGLQLTTNPGGLAITRDEIAQLVVQELMRVSSPDALDARATPGLPGTRMLLTGNPRQFKPLVEAIADANEYLLRRIEAGPTSEPMKTPGPSAKEPSADEDDAILSLPADDTGQTIDAARIMAGITPQKLA